MKKMLMLAILAAFGAAAAAHAEEAYYVQSVKARVMAAPSFKAVVIGTVNKGHKFTALGREKNWIKVRHDFQEGYVSSLLVSPQPPMEKIALIKAEDKEIKQGVRRRASTYTSAAAARGLTADDRRRLSKEEKVDYESLEKIESFTLSQDEVAKFMEAAR